MKRWRTLSVTVPTVVKNFAGNVSNWDLYHHDKRGTSVMQRRRTASVAGPFSDALNNSNDTNDTNTSSVASSSCTDLCHSRGFMYPWNERRRHTAAPSGHRSCHSSTACFLDSTCSSSLLSPFPHLFLLLTPFSSSSPLPPAPPASRPTSFPLSFLSLFSLTSPSSSFSSLFVLQEEKDFLLPVSPVFPQFFLRHFLIFTHIPLLPLFSAPFFLPSWPPPSPCLHSTSSHSSFLSLTHPYTFSTSLLFLFLLLLFFLQLFLIPSVLFQSPGPISSSFLFSPPALLTSFLISFSLYHPLLQIFLLLLFFISTSFSSPRPLPVPLSHLFSLFPLLYLFIVHLFRSNCPSFLHSFSFNLLSFFLHLLSLLPPPLPPLSTPCCPPQPPPLTPSASISGSLNQVWWWWKSEECSSADLQSTFSFSKTMTKKKKNCCWLHVGADFGCRMTSHCEGVFPPWHTRRPFHCSQFIFIDLKNIS